MKFAFVIGLLLPRIAFAANLSPSMSCSGCTAPYPTRPQAPLPPSPVAVIRVAAKQDLNFGPVPAGYSMDKTIALENTGSLPAQFQEKEPSYFGDIHFDNGVFPGSTGTCGKTLGAGATCTIMLTYTPSAGSSAVTESFPIAYDNGRKVDYLQLMLRGTTK